MRLIVSDGAGMLAALLEEVTEKNLTFNVLWVEAETRRDCRHGLI